MSRKRPSGGMKFAPRKFTASLDANFEGEKWEKLNTAISAVYERKTSDLSFEELYRAAYNLVLNKKGDFLYSKLEDKLKQMTRTGYQRIVTNRGDEVLLDSIVTEWERHSTALKVLSQILMYMDKSYVAAEKKRNVQELGYSIFAELVVHGSFRVHLTQALTSMVRKDREGEAIDPSLLRKSSEMLTGLGNNSYGEVWEKEYLRMSRAYYVTTSAELVSSHTCADYCKKATDLIAAEIDRAENVMNPETLPKVEQLLNDEVLQAHIAAVLDMGNAGFSSLLDDDRIEDLQIVYRVFSRIDEVGMNEMKWRLQKRIIEMGREVVTSQDNLKNPIAFIEAVIKLQDKFLGIVKGAFQDDQHFINSHKKGFESFLNECKRSAEFLSLFVDRLMKEGAKGMTETEVDGNLDNAILLFRHLQEKDVFENYYRRHLGRRLMAKKSASSDLEKSFISKLKKECGVQFSSKLEVMITDMDVSDDVMTKFKESSVEADLKFKFSVSVLTTGPWILSSKGDCNLTKEMTAACETFKSFYSHRNSGKTLTWHLSYGDADVSAVFPKGKYEINVTTFAAVVLQAFNDQPEGMTVESLEGVTGVKGKDMVQLVQTFALGKHKLLTKKPPAKEVEPADELSVNTRFSSKLKKFRIALVTAKKESAEEVAQTKKNVEEDRKPQIEAAIVRVMKSRKTLDHNSLIAEVASLMSDRFTAVPSFIKARIESLIEREYLERDSEDRKRYHYCAA